MKYTIETTPDGCMETIELHDGSKYTKHIVKTEYGSESSDYNFSDQMEADGICEETLEKVEELFDSFFADDFMEIAEMIDQ